MTPERWHDRGVARDLPISDEEFRRFKRLLYGDAASDWTGVYEAWWSANGEFPALAASERLFIAEQAVAALLASGHVELYRGLWGGDRPSDPVPRDEHETVLREWATWVIPPADPPSTSPVVWMSAAEPDSAEAWKTVLDSL